MSKSSVNKKSMKFLNHIYTFLLALALLTACQEPHSHDEAGGHPHEEEGEHGHEEEHHEDEVHLSEQQFEALAMKVDSLPLRNMEAYVATNGHLEIPPQNEAAVTAIVGVNINSIKVIEGDKIGKGQVLAYASHPNLVQMQMEYAKHWHDLKYLEQEYERQQTLYTQKVGVGKDLQKTTTSLATEKALVNGMELQLNMLGIDVAGIQEGKMTSQIAVRSPISGYVRFVAIKTGQFAAPQTTLFEIVNTEHIHADFMVFEKDAAKVKIGQKVTFNLSSDPQNTLDATVYSVGKNFEQAPKAIHLHAEIKGHINHLIPGMYVQGKIHITNTQSPALPEEAIVREGDRYFIFAGNKKTGEHGTEWAFKPIEVVLGEKDGTWVAVSLLQPLAEGASVAWNNAYYLMAEMKKGEAEHSH